MYQTDEVDNDNEYENLEDFHDADMPFALIRLNRLLSTDLPTNYTGYNETYFNEYTIEEKRIVLKMPLEVFQERLLHHFDSRF